MPPLPHAERLALSGAEGGRGALKGGESGFSYPHPTAHFHRRTMV